MNYRMFSLGAIATAVAAVLAVAPVFAADQASPRVVSEPKPASGAALEPKDASGAVVLPACLEALAMSEQQQNQVTQIIREYDADLALVWKQFSARYLDAIQTETLLLAAIEDNLSEGQRNQVRQQRRKTAHHQKSLAGMAVTPQQAEEAPSSAVEDEMEIGGVSLTAEQEAAADKVQEKYLGRLRSLNRDIQGLHIRLVSLEADKFVEIEKILTKDQLQKLREVRSDAPTERKTMAKQTVPATTR